MPYYPEKERKSRIQLSWNTYLDLENEIIDFLRYVPLVESHLEVFSPKLATIILQVGPEVINAFNLSVGNVEDCAKAFADLKTENPEKDAVDALWTEETRLRTRNQSLSYKKYYDLLELYWSYKPSKSEIKVLDNLSFVLNPFNQEAPNWWNVYNGLKHDKYDSLSKATLFEALISLGALFWTLDCCAKEIRMDNITESKLFVRIKK